MYYYSSTIISLGESSEHFYTNMLIRSEKNPKLNYVLKPILNLTGPLRTAQDLIGFVHCIQGCGANVLIKTNTVMLKT